MLTEHEQLADHEARINKQELMQKLQPLQQPLDNIEEIRRALNDEWQPFETAPDDIYLLWCFAYTEESNRFEYFAQDKPYIEILLSAYATSTLLLRDFIGCFWKHLPPPPKEQK